MYPSIKLSGLWIEHAGFLPGQQARITVVHGKLIITAT
ncbi:SymE family type I addiction module toxin [Caballeronia sp.]